MKIPPGLLAILLVTTAVAQTTPSARPPAPRTTPAKDAGRPNAMRPPDPDLFDGSKFEKEVRPETGMIGEFEMPGSADSQDSKVGGQPGQPGGGQQPPPGATPAAGAAGAAGAQSAAGAQAAASAGGAAGSAGSEGGGGSSGAENAGAAGAVGGALDQSKPMSNSGQSGGSGGSPEGMAADQLKGGGAEATAAAKAAGQTKSSGRIGSAELRIETLPESEKDVVGREAAPGGTQGSNRAMPSGQGGQGAQNQNKGVEKGKVMPKGL